MYPSCSCRHKEGHIVHAERNMRNRLILEDIPETTFRKDYRYEIHTVKPRPEVHMDMILFEVFLKNIHLIPQDQIVQ